MFGWSRPDQWPSRMSWTVHVTIQDIGSIGELVGALATVVTLAYLALQIRRSNILTTAESRRFGWA